MKIYQIQSIAGVDYGCWAGDSARDAFRAMLDDTGGTYGSPEAGTEHDWIVSLRDDAYSSQEWLDG